MKPLFEWLPALRLVCWLLDSLYVELLWGPASKSRHIVQL